MERAGNRERDKTDVPIAVILLVIGVDRGRHRQPPDGGHGSLRRHRHRLHHRCLLGRQGGARPVSLGAKEGENIHLRVAPENGAMHYFHPQS